MRSMFNLFQTPIKSGLAILDNYFPNIMTAFRVAEFNYYLNKFPDAIIYSSSSEFAQQYTNYSKIYPQNAKNIKSFKKAYLKNHNLAYFVFLDNARYFLPYLEKYNVPFVMTLYPGGGFLLNDAKSDRELKKVLISNNCQKIITTQKVTEEYVKSLNLIPSNKVEYIYGVVLPQSYFTHNIPRVYYDMHKPQLDICFVAFKYVPFGLNKGYDIFIEVAKKISQIMPNARFHVVGNFDASDINIDDIAAKISFYGSQPTHFFHNFYSTMDIIISPSRPISLYQGSFDGFPTGCCVEASLSGVAMFCTDIFKLNYYYEDGVEICIVQLSADDIIERVSYYYHNPQALADLAMRGQQKSKELYGPKKQLHRRFEILNNCLTTA